MTVKKAHQKDLKHSVIKSDYLKFVAHFFHKIIIY